MAGVTTRSERVRIVHIVHRLTRNGGIPRVNRQVLAGLDRSAFEVHALSTRPLHPTDRLDELGDVWLHTLDFTGRPTARSEVIVSLRVAAALRRIRPHLLHVDSGTARRGALAPLAVPHAARVIDVHDAPGSGRHSQTTDRIEMALVKRATFHPVVHSRSVALDTTRYLGGTQWPLTQIPLGVETEVPPRESAERFRADLGIDPSQLLVYYVGRGSVKNPRAFVEVGRELHRELGDRLALVLVGRQTDDVRKLAETLGERVIRLVDFLPNLGVLHLAGDLMVSTSSYEGFGLAIAEAMAAGVPVVAYQAGGVTDVIVDGMTGVMVEPGQHGALVRAALDLLRDAERRLTMGQHARNRVLRHFSVERMVSDYAEFYERLALSRGRT